MKNWSLTRPSDRGIAESAATLVAVLCVALSVAFLGKPVLWTDLSAQRRAALDMVELAGRRRAVRADLRRSESLTVCAAVRSGTSTGARERRSAEIGACLSVLQRSLEQTAGKPALWTDLSAQRRAALDMAELAGHRRAVHADFRRSEPSAVCAAIRSGASIGARERNAAELAGRRRAVHADLRRSEPSAVRAAFRSGVSIGAKEKHTAEIGAYLPAFQRSLERSVSAGFACIAALTVAAGWAFLVRAALLARGRRAFRSATGVSH